MLGKRYTVAVVGLSGSSAAQRSEVGRFRRERDALACGAEERDRLSVAHGPGARNYRVVVERDGVVLQSLSPEAPADEEAHVLPDPDTLLDHLTAPPGDDDPGPPGDAPDDEDLSDTATSTVIRPGGGPPPEPPRRRTERMPSWDDVPSGRVPDDVLRYFEDAVAREEQRRARRHGGAEAHPEESAHA